MHRFTHRSQINPNIFNKYTGLPHTTHTRQAVVLLPYLIAVHTIQNGSPPRAAAAASPSAHFASASTARTPAGICKGGGIMPKPSPATLSFTTSTSYNNYRNLVIHIIDLTTVPPLSLSLANAITCGRRALRCACVAGKAIKLQTCSSVILSMSTASMSACSEGKGASSLSGGAFSTCVFTMGCSATATRSVPRNPNTLEIRHSNLLTEKVVSSSRCASVVDVGERVEHQSERSFGARLAQVRGLQEEVGAECGGAQNTDGRAADGALSLVAPQPHLSVVPEARHRLKLAN
ncbi:hypothetical protein PRIPAC_93779 [Pristionchus pacificus]|uniref:Uncharacterized protein n=1 Tax=Pristionchus pacificus TaxID=54126 RepID=A0A2A6B9Z4_PRIPA|nr:hypothetical protein PRIPAC_93779 [Pristionchus pacificus]|eukprot:PDM62700.1 hypothetical protein PRIPAC_49915 [Pristionchus pacificus]